MSDLQNSANLQSRLINFFADKDQFNFDLFPSFKLCKLAEDGITLEIYLYYQKVLFLPAGFSALGLPELYPLLLQMCLLSTFSKVTHLSGTFYTTDHVPLSFLIKWHIFLTI